MKLFIGLFSIAALLTVLSTAAIRAAWEAR